MTIHTGGIHPRYQRALMLGAAILALPVTALPAFAQDQAPTDETADSRDIIVTAQRRNERLEEVPMSVQVVSQDVLSNAGVNTVRELANVTSGFQVGNSGSFPQPSIRGITTITAGSYENNVAVFVDGLYQVTPQVLNMDLPNVQSIQVLKGPQGTLYGRNATGGALLIDTIDPGKAWAGSVEVTYGSFDDRRLRGYAAGPVTEGVGIALSGNLRRTDGYYKVASLTTPGQFTRGLPLKQDAFRAKLKADVTDSFRVTLAYNYLRASDARGVIFTPIENVSSPYTGNNATRPRGLGEVAGDAFTLELKQHEGSLKLELDTGLGMVRSITGYTAGNTRTTYDADGTYNPTGYSDSLLRDRTWQQSLDFTITAIDRLDLIVGGNYYHISTDYDPSLANVAYSPPPGAVPGTPLSSYVKFQEIFYWRTKEAWAGFIDGTFHVTDRLSINVGGRYSTETQDLAAQLNRYCTNPATATTCAGSATGVFNTTVYTRAQSASQGKYGKFTPRASIRYEISPRTNVYFSYSQGFRGGEWNAVPPSETNLAQWATLGQVGQESVSAFELGVKSAGSRLRFDASAFYYDYSDLHVSTTVFVGATALVTLQSIPKAKVYGLEANLDFDVTDNFKIRAGATWLHARYGDRSVYVAGGVNPNLAAFSVGDDPLKNFQNQGTLAQNISGLQMARAPNFSAFFGMDYKVPIGDGGLLFAANVKYTDSYAVTEPTIWGGEPLAAYNSRLALDPAALPNNAAVFNNAAGQPYVGRASEQRARQPKFALVNASVTWTDPSDHFYVRVWGNNLTDIRYRQNYRVSGSTYIPQAEPRTFGGTIGAKF